MVVRRVFNTLEVDLCFLVCRKIVSLQRGQTDNSARVCAYPADRYLSLQQLKERKTDEKKSDMGSDGWSGYACSGVRKATGGERMAEEYAAGRRTGHGAIYRAEGGQQQ
jgi:hypothetical protein